MTAPDDGLRAALRTAQAESHKRGYATAVLARADLDALLDLLDAQDALLHPEGRCWCGAGIWKHLDPAADGYHPAPSSEAEVSEREGLRAAAQGLLDALRVEGLTKHGPWSAETGDAIDDLNRALASPDTGVAEGAGLDALPDNACGVMGLCELLKGHEGKHTTSVNRALEGVVLRATPAAPAAAGTDRAEPGLDRETLRLGFHEQRQQDSPYWGCRHGNQYPASWECERDLRRLIEEAPE